MSNPLLAGLKDSGTKNDNPLLAGVTSSKTSKPSKMAISPITPAKAAEADVAGEFLRTLDIPAGLQELGEPWEGAKPGQRGLLGIGRFGMAIPGLAISAVDEISKSMGQNAAEAVDAPYVDRVATGLASAPRAVGSAVKKLFIEPQTQMMGQGVDEVKQGIEALKAGDFKTAQALISGGATRTALGAVPVAGPMVQAAEERVASGDTVGAVLEGVPNALLLGAGLQAPKAASAKRFNEGRARAKATKAYTDALLETATEQGKPFDLNAALKKAAESPVEDLVDTANALKKGLEERKAAKSPEESFIERNPPPKEVDPQTAAMENLIDPKRSPEINISDAELADALGGGEVVGYNAKDGKPIVRFPENITKPVMPETSQIAKPEVINQAPENTSKVIQDSQIAKSDVSVTNGQVVSADKPSFTQGDQPGANYTSEQLKAFKEKNGIADEPRQMVGERKGEKGAVRPDLLFGLPAEVLGKVAETATGGKGVIAAAGGNRGRDIPPSQPPTGGTVPPGELPKYAGSVNLERLNTTDQVKSAILDDYKARKGEIDAKRKNPVSQEETLRAAREIGLDAGKVERLLKQNPNYAAEVTAVREHNLAVRGQVSKIQEKALKERAEKGEVSATTLIEYQEALSKASVAHEAIQGRSAEIGRALNAHKIYAEAARLAKTKPEQAIQILQKQLGENWKQNSEFILDRISKLDPNDTAGFNRLMRDYTKFSAGDKLYAYWVANLLSGVGTQVKNIAGNTVMAGAEVASRALTSPKEAVASIKGRTSGMKEGFEAALQVMRDGIKPEQAAKLDLPMFYEFPGGWKNPWNAPGRLLSAADSIFKTTALKGELNAQAVRIASKEKLKGEAYRKRVQELISNPTPEMLEAAIKQSKYETFTSDPGEFAKGFLHWREKSIGGVQPLKYASPFVNVANNLMKRGLEYSPAGTLRLLKGGADRGQVLARSAIGTAVTLYAIEKASSGELTGAAPRESADRDAFFRQGKQPYSIRVNDRWVRYTDMGPLALNFIAVAAVNDAKKQFGKFDDSKVLTESIGNIASGFTEQSFMKGLKDMSDLFSGKQAGAGERAAASIGGGMVPGAGFLRSMRGLTDDTLRDPDGVYERVMNGIPVLSEKVPSKLNAMGEEQQNSRLNSIMGFGLRKASVQNPDIEKELARLEIAPSVKTESLRVKNETKELDRDQLREFQKQLGDARKEALRELFGSSSYRQMNDEQKAKAVDKALDRVYGRVREKFVKANPNLKAKPQKSKLFSLGVN